MADINKLMERGDKAFDMQDFKRAAKFFKRIIDIKNKDIGAMHKYAVCLCFIGKADPAIQLFNKALALNPDKETKLEIESNLANVYMFKGEATGNYDFYDKAIEINKKMVAEVEDNEGAYLNLGNLYKYKKEFKKSIKSFKEGLRKYPNSQRLIVHLANALRASCTDLNEEPKSAIELYKKAKEIDPDYIGAYVNLGLTYMSEGKEELAANEFLEAYKRDPEDPCLLGAMKQLEMLSDNMEFDAKSKGKKFINLRC